MGGGIWAMATGRGYFFLQSIENAAGTFFKKPNRGSPLHTEVFLQNF